MGKLKELIIKYKEIILYVFFGGLTTLVNWGSYAVLANLFKVDYLVSTAIAWFISVLFAYVTNRTWVFESKAKGVKAISLEIISFFGFRLLSGFMDMGLMYLGVDIIGINHNLMKLLSNVVVVIANYVFSKLFIFRKPKENDEIEVNSIKEETEI